MFEWLKPVDEECLNLRTYPPTLPVGAAGCDASLLDLNGNTAVCAAATKGNMESIRALLMQGCDAPVASYIDKLPREKRPKLIEMYEELGEVSRSLGCTCCFELLSIPVDDERVGRLAPHTPTI